MIPSSHTKIYDEKNDMFTLEALRAIQPLEIHNEVYKLFEVR